MALDAEKLRAHLKESGIFSDAEIDAEVLSAVKDSKAEERRAILNTQKTEAPAVAQSSPAIAAAPAAVVAAPVPAAAVPPAAKPITSATTPAELFDMRPKGTPVERIGKNINEAATAAAPVVADVASNVTQDSLNYARDAIANNPELTGALAAIPVMYGANKLGLFDTLGSKMSSAAQPQPFVGGSGPRNTPPPAPLAAQPQAWDIHGEPPLFAPTPAAAPTVTAAPAAAPVNTKLQELQARAAAGTPATGEFVGPMQPVGPPEFIGPRKPVPPTTNAPTPSAAPNSPATKAVTNTIQQLGQAETPVAGAAMPSRPVTPTPAAALPQRVQTAITGVPKTVQDQYAKEGKVVLKGYGVGDRSLTNTYGIPAYAKIIDYFNEGKPIGDDANYQIIRKKINQGVPASLAAEFAAKLPGSEAEAGNFGKAFGETGAYTKDGKVVTSPAAMKKAVAGGGALFLATAFPNIVNAGESAIKGDYAKAGGQAAEVGSGFLPPALQALIYSGGLNAGAEEEARQLRMRDYALKAGRGVAQGYDPRQLIGVAPPTR